MCSHAYTYTHIRTNTHMYIYKHDHNIHVHAHMHTYICAYICMYIKSGRESWPRKVELTRAHSKNMTTAVSILHVTLEIANIPTETTLPH